VPWHLSGSLGGTAEAGTELARGGWGGEVQKGLAQAYLNQTTNNPSNGGGLTGR
jgi:hypothetical protein